MRRPFARSIFLLLALLLLACGLACADDRYDSRNASITAVADADRLELDKDASLVTYTVTVPKQCVKITLQAGGPGADGTFRVCSEMAFDADSEGVSVVVQGQSAVWTIPCDFLSVSMDGLRVKAQIPMGEKADYLYADVPIKIDYPAYTADTLHEAYMVAVARNTDGSYLFTVPAADGALVSEGLSALPGGPEAGGGFLYPAGARVAPYGGDIPGNYVPEGRKLFSLRLPNDDFAACYAGEGVRVADSARAILCARADVLPDAQRYPVAALLQQKAQAFLDGLPQAGLDAPRLALAIYERVYNLGLTALPPENYSELPEAERAYYEQTAYGLLSGFGGDRQGYADAFFLLCNLAGIPCAMLPCELVGGGEGGCVNAVQLENAWYIVDVYAAAGAADMYAGFCLSGAEAAEYYVLDAPGLELAATSAYHDAAFLAGEVS